MSQIVKRTFGPDRHDPVDKPDMTHCIYCGEKLTNVDQFKGENAETCPGGPTGNDVADAVIVELLYRAERRDEEIAARFRHQAVLIERQVKRDPREFERRFVALALGEQMGVPLDDIKDALAAGTGRYRSSRRRRRPE